MLSGPSALFIDGFAQAILIDVRTYPTRGIAEPDLERVTRGSRDGFVETLLFNANLIRRRVREAYRLSRLPLKEEIAALGDVRSLQLAFVYLGEDNAPFAEIEAKMRRLLAKLAKKLQK